jgi:hypothetical protein
VEEPGFQYLDEVSFCGALSDNICLYPGRDQVILAADFGTCTRSRQ